MTRFSTSRGRSTFGIPPDSDESDLDESDYSDEFGLDSSFESDSDSLLSASPSSASSDSFCYLSDSQVPILLPLVFLYSMSNCLFYFMDRKPISNIRDPAELRYIEETIAAIRLRTRHHDPYEEWEKQTRKDAFVRGYIILVLIAVY
jgi:nucleoporin GLE1